MARAKAKAKATTSTGSTPAPKHDGPIVEEMYFRSDSAYLCMILNRRTDFVRVIDFRAGALPAKRLYIQSVAKQEGVQKVITLVEKDEVSSWTKVGFVREGTIPGFYKRSDGHLCGCVISDKTASPEVDDAGQKLAERTINAGKRLSKDIPESFRGATVTEVDDDDAFKARDAIWKKGEGIGAFDVFGRDAERAYYECTYKKARPNFIMSEYQDCFGHSLIEILRSPADDDEIRALVAGLRQIGDELTERGIVSAFAFGPSDDEMLSAAYLAAGYRKTGLLASGVKIADGRRDAILWTRKLANPAEDE